MAAARREERAGKGPIADDSEELQVDTSDDEPDADEGAGTIVLAGAAEAAGAAEVAITQVATHHEPHLGNLRIGPRLLRSILVPRCLFL